MQIETKLATEIKIGDRVYLGQTDSLDVESIETPADKPYVILTGLDWNHSNHTIHLGKQTKWKVSR